MSAAFKDHFSGHAADYSRFRPLYPAALVDHLAALAPGRELAWDAATGSGQLAVALAGRFRSVVATDASAAQIAEAEPHPRVRYRAEPAEESSLAAGSAALVTVAQALHWLDLERFYAEVRRVLVPGGVIAAFCYALLSVGGEVSGESDASPEIDGGINGEIGRLYRDTVGRYWPPERRLVDAGYRGLPFPFEALEAPAFEIEQRWSLEQLLGYLGTWSAVRRCRAAEGADPLESVGRRLAELWGGAGERRVSWPIHLRLGKA